MFLRISLYTPELTHQSYAVHKLIYRRGFTAFDIAKSNSSNQIIFLLLSVCFYMSVCAPTVDCCLALTATIDKSFLLI